MRNAHIALFQSNYKMKKLLISSIIALVGTLSANAISFRIDQNFGSDPIEVDAVLTNVTGGVKFVLTVDSTNTGNIADLIAFYAELKTGSLASTITSVVGTEVTSYVASDDGANGTGPYKINGGSWEKPNDLFVQIGVNGIGGGDDFQTTAFTVFSSSITASDFSLFGIRAQSVGPVGGPRGGSSKVLGPADEIVVVPDSGTTLALLGAALLALIGFRSRKS